MSEPEEIVTMSGQKMARKCSIGNFIVWSMLFCGLHVCVGVDYISFSAHTDYEQTSHFVRVLKPPHIVSSQLHASVVHDHVMLL